jgi:hypothetical protein
MRSAGVFYGLSSAAMVHRIFYTLHGLVLLGTLIWGLPGLLFFLTIPAHLIYGAMTWKQRADRDLPPPGPLRAGTPAPTRDGPSRQSGTPP